MTRALRQFTTLLIVTLDLICSLLDSCPPTHHAKFRMCWIDKDKSFNILMGVEVGFRGLILCERLVK